ncbi:NAD(P)-binding protein, partial [Acinetobacter baumannii]
MIAFRETGIRRRRDRPCLNRCRRADIGSWNTPKFRGRSMLQPAQSVGIIGAGPAGLTAAYELVRSGVDVELLEAGA